MLVPVPLGIGRDVGQPEIGGQIDDLQMPGKTGDDLLGRAVRQAAEHDLEPRPVDLEIVTRSGRSSPARCGNTAPIGLPAWRSAVNATISACRMIARAGAAARPRYSRWRRVFRSEPCPVCHTHRHSNRPRYGRHARLARAYIAAPPAFVRPADGRVEPGDDELGRLLIGSSSARRIMVDFARRPLWHRRLAFP